MEVIHTATHNVNIIDTAFYLPVLNRYRRIWLYLPPQYIASKKRYPVIYMHDGQNLFDSATAFGDEWGIDKTLNSMKQPCIVVGIDNGREKRMNEYNFWDNEEFGKGEGDAYIRSIVTFLKPHIDATYRTLPDAKNTFIGGSSMGGLISFFAGVHYPEVFGGIGVFSPSFWLVPGIADAINPLLQNSSAYEQRYFFYGGGNEGGSMIENINAVIHTVQQYPHCTVKSVVDAEGDHSEKVWRRQFGTFYRWMSHKKRAILI